MNTPEEEPEETIKGINAADLLARGLESGKAATGNPQAWQPPTPEELAALLPQYEIESLLGRGGMGAVYRGKQAALDRAVAIKLLPAELAADAEFLARFQREARTLAKLQHPGIVAVHDFGQTSAGHLYFVMEFVNGTDLSRLIHGPGINSVQALEVIAQICDALQYAHSQGVIHRDIKPANVLINQEGRAKLADFGLARPTSEETASLTRSNVVMGTPDYMAPEQMAGTADHRADLYALGVMLYEMLTGQTPRGAWAPPSQRVQVDVRLDQVVVRALQQDPAMRYQQASEIKTDVDVIRTTPLPKARKGKLKSGPEAPGQRTTPLPKAKKPRNRLVLAAMVVLPLLAVVAWWAVQEHPSPTPPDSNIPWQRVEHSPAEWQALGLTGDGWVNHVDEQKKIMVFDVGSAAGAYRKFAVRARAKGTKPNIGGFRFERPLETNLSIRFYNSQVIADGERGASLPMRTVPHANPAALGDECVLEMAVLDNQVFTRFNNGSVGTFTFESLPPCEALCFTGSDSSVRDIEYAILDGIPDPLKALGWEVPPAVASAPAIATPSEAVLKARNDGGKLMIWGKTRRGPASVGGAAGFDDFVQVAVEGNGWAARRTGKEEAWLAASSANLSVKDVPFSVRGRSLSRAGLIAVLDGKDGAYRDPIYFNGAVTEPKAITLLKAGGMSLWLGATGAILAGKTLTGEQRIQLTDDFFTGAAAFTASEENFLTARKAASVESWNPRTGQKHEFPLRSEDVLEMDAAADFVAILTKDGQVRLFMDDGRPLRSVDPRLTRAPSGSGPFVAVRAGRGMVAAQRPDGSWIAWGESEALAAKVASLGHVTDLDLDYDPKDSELLIWIEPVIADDSSKAAEVTWQRVERSAEEWAKTGQALKDGWVHNPNKNILLFDRLSAAKATSQFAVRTKVKFHETESNLPFVNQTAGGHTWRKIQIFSFKQIIFNGDRPPGITQRHVSKVELDEEALVEMLVAGDKVYTRFNGQPVVTGDLSPIIPWEQCHLMGGLSYSLRDIEYAILDGVAEPLKVLGWEVAEETPSKPIELASQLPWQTLKRSDPEWNEQVFSLQDEWIHFKTSPSKPHQIRLTAAAPSGNPGLFKDAMIRVHYRWNPEAGLNPQLTLITKSRSENTGVEALLAENEITLRVAGTPPFEKHWPLPKPLQAGDEGMFELAVIGKSLLVRLNGETVMEENVETNRTGGLTVRVLGCLLRDIQHLNLDGIPDPLKTLGWEMAADTADKTAASLSPWKKAVWSEKQRPFVAADGWFVFGGELRQFEPRDTDEQVVFRDGAVRAKVRFTTNKSAAMSFWLRQPMEHSVSFLMSESELVARRNTGNSESLERGRIVFDTPLRPGEIVQFEAASVGDTFVVRFNGKELRFQDSHAVTRAGRVTFHGRMYEVKDVEYAILDGISDPWKTLGWEVAEGAEAPHQEGWRDFLAEIAEGPHKNEQLGSFWKREDNGWRVAKYFTFMIPDETGRDLAIRATGTGSRLSVFARSGYSGSLFASAGLAKIQRSDEVLKQFKLGQDFDASKGHSVGLRTIGNTLTLLVDDVELGSVQDDTHPVGGQFGVTAGEGGLVEKVEYRFMGE